ncbi:MAG: fimbria/pilus outer membrane usher protein [Burkholderiales bacterium]
MTPAAAPGADEAQLRPNVPGTATTVNSDTNPDSETNPGSEAGATPQSSDEQPVEIYASINVNAMPAGIFLVFRYPDGNFAVRESDLNAAGIQHLSGQTVTLAGNTYILLDSIEGAAFEFDERRVEIAIQIDPAEMRNQVIDARRRTAPGNVIYPDGTSAYFNYALSHDDIEYSSDTFSAEAGVRFGDFLFFSDGFYERLEDSDRSVRLRTNLTYDNRETLQRFVVGDLVSSSGALGSTLNLGGVSFAKSYEIDPYLIRYPFASYSGLAPAPARYEVLVNGTRVSTGTVGPGPFEITNIQGPLGISDVEVVVRDAFGREQAYSTPFYFTQAALRQGLAEYNFALGSQRRQFGTVSNDYGPAAGSAYYRYGVSNSLTLGGRGEATSDVFNIGPNITYLAGRWGLFNTTVSYSNNPENDGYAGVFDYAIQTRKFNATASVLSQSEHYTRVGIDPQFNVRLDARTTFSYGPFTLSYLTRRPYQSVDRTVYGISVTPRMPTPKLSLFASLRRIVENDSSLEFYVGINYFFRDNYSVSAAARTLDDDYQVSSSIQKTVPVGEGWGFSAQATQFDDSRGEGHSLRPFVQYNSRYATLIADYQNVSIGDDTIENAHVALSGSISTVGNRVMLSRPVSDAFALVQVDGLEGVRVYQGSQLSGTTDSNGRLLMPSLSSYVHNQISIDSRDVPIDFEMKHYTARISPALHGGGVLDFGAKRIRAVAGTLKLHHGDQISMASYGEVSLVMGGKQVVLPVGQAGDFFIENVDSESYTLSYSGKTGLCSAELEIPESDEAIIELGDVACVAQ